MKLYRKNPAIDILAFDITPVSDEEWEIVARAEFNQREKIYGGYGFDCKIIHTSKESYRFCVRNRNHAGPHVCGASRELPLLIWY